MIVDVYMTPVLRNFSGLHSSTWLCLTLCESEVVIGDRTIHAASGPIGRFNKTRTRHA